MRCFVAVDIADELKAQVINIQNQLAGIGDVKLVEPENLHFTLKFLGEITEQQSENVKKVLANVSSSFTPFQIIVKNLGAFPSSNYIRVIWLGAPLLYSLQKTIDDSLFPEYLREREIKPHLTLARVRSVVGKENLADFIKNNESIEIGSMLVGKIKLKKSVLTPSGPIYEDIAVLELGK